MGATFGLSLLELCGTWRRLEDMMEKDDPQDIN